MPSCSPFRFTKGKYVLPQELKPPGSDAPSGRITVFSLNPPSQNGGLASTSNISSNRAFEQRPANASGFQTARFPSGSQAAEKPPRRRPTAFLPEPAQDEDEDENDEDVEDIPKTEFKKVTRKSIERMALAQYSSCHDNSLATLSVTTSHHGNGERVSFEARNPEEFISEDMGNEEENATCDRLSVDSERYDFRKKLSADEMSQGLSTSRNSYNSTSTNSEARSSHRKDMTVSDLVQTDPDEDQSSRIRKAGVLAQPVDGAASLSKLTVDYVEKDDESRKLIQEAITANEFLKNIMYEDRLQSVIDAMSSKQFDTGSYVIREGEIGSHLYVSADGQFEVIKDGKVVKTFGPGVAFGELAILYKARRFASIRVTTKATVWTLERTMYSRIMMKSRRQEQEENVRFLCSVPLFHDVHPVEINRICDILKREFYQTGTAIVRQGEPGDKFYIIRGGRVAVTRRESDLTPDKPQGVLGTGEYFGEQALISDEGVRLATVTALAPGAECLSIDRVAFTELLGNLKDLKEKKYPGALGGNAITVNKVINKDFAHIRLSDLEIVGTLGVGGFGRVELVRHWSRTTTGGTTTGTTGGTTTGTTTTGGGTIASGVGGSTIRTFALKCLQKVDIVQQQQQQHVYNEKHVMLHCDSNFICRLYNTYKDTKYLYFLMEACLGGDVWTALHKAKSFDDRTARFMAACVVEAFDYLHARNMIYRDLKPENLMLDENGYIKLVDFGFAKRVDPGTKAWTFAGTPEYVAPEVIQNRGHDRAVDYWALGIFIHELLVGKPPFRGSDNMRTYHQILKGIDQVQMPSKISRKAQELIRKLCRPSPTERLGYQKNGLQDVKNHPWYSSVNFNWTSLRNQTMPAPIVRPVQSNVDMSNFDRFPPNRDFPPDENSGFDINF